MPRLRLVMNMSITDRSNMTSAVYRGHKSTSKIKLKIGQLVSEIFTIENVNGQQRISIVAIVSLFCMSLTKLSV